MSVFLLVVGGLALPNPIPIHVDKYIHAFLNPHAMLEKQLRYVLLSVTMKQNYLYPLKDKKKSNSNVFLRVGSNRLKSINSSL